MDLFVRCPFCKETECTVIHKHTKYDEVICYNCKKSYLKDKICLNCRKIDFCSKLKAVKRCYKLNEVKPEIEQPTLGDYLSGSGF